MYVYVFIYICIYVRVYIEIHLYIHMYIYTHVHMPICIHISIFTSIYVFIYIYQRILSHIDIYMIHITLGGPPACPATNHIYTYEGSCHPYRSWALVADKERTQHQLFQWFRIRLNEVLVRRILRKWAIRVRKMCALNLAMHCTRARRDTRLRVTIFRVLHEHLASFVRAQKRANIVVRRICAGRRRCCASALRLWQWLAVLQTRQHRISWLELAQRQTLRRSTRYMYLVHEAEKARLLRWNAQTYTVARNVTKKLWSLASWILSTWAWHTQHQRDSLHAAQGAEKARLLRRKVELYTAARNATYTLWSLASRIMSEWAWHTRHRRDEVHAAAHKMHRSRVCAIWHAFKIHTQQRRRARVAEGATRKMQVDLMQCAWTVLAVHTKNWATRRVRTQRTDLFCARQTVRQQQECLARLLCAWRGLLRKNVRVLERVHSRCNMRHARCCRSALVTWIWWAQKRRSISAAHMQQLVEKSLLLNFQVWSRLVHRQKSRRRIQQVLVRDRRVATISSVFLALKYVASIGEHRHTKLQVFGRVRSPLEHCDISKQSRLAGDVRPHVKKQSQTNVCSRSPAQDECRVPLAVPSLTSSHEPDSGASTGDRKSVRASQHESKHGQRASFSMQRRSTSSSPHISRLDFELLN